MADQPLDATKYGDPEECKSVALWLKGAVHDAFNEAHSDVGKVVSNSRHYWDGDAAMAFREALKDPYFQADTCANEAENIGKAMDSFAGDLKDSFKKLDAACDAARDGELNVSGETDAQGRDHRIIEPPINFPNPTGGPSTDAEMEAYQNDLKKWNKQQVAFAVAAGKIRAGRLAENNAHRELRKALGDAGSKLSKALETMNKLMKGKGRISTTAKALLMAADELASTSAIGEKVVLGKKLTAAESRTAAMWSALDKAYAEEGPTGTRAQSVQSFSDKIQAHAATADLRKLEKTLNFDVTFGSVRDKVPVATFKIKNEAILKKVRGIPLINTTFQVANAVDSVAKGRDWEKVAIDQAIDTGGSAAAGGLVKGAVRVVRFGNFYVLIGTTLATEVVIPVVKDEVDKKIMDNEFEDYVYYKEDK